MRNTLRTALVVPALAALGLRMEAAEAQLTITEVTSPSLGTVIAGSAGRQFTLNVDGTVSGVNAADHLYGSSEGMLVVQKQWPPAFAFLTAENITTTGGVTVNAVPCQLQNRPQQNCDGDILWFLAIGRRTLRVGVDITTSQTHSGGDTASASYDISIVFF